MLVCLIFMILNFNLLFYKSIKENASKWYNAVNNNVSNETIKRKYIKTLIGDTGLATAINNFQNILDVIWSNVFNAPKFDRYS